MLSIEKLKLTLEKNISNIDSKFFSNEIFNLFGIFVIRSAFKKEEISFWQNTWNKFYDTNLIGREVNQFNPVELLEEIPNELFEISKHEKILNIMEMIHGENIGLFKTRFVIKDSHSRNHKVPLHDDYSYQIGWPNKTSVFLAINHANEDNGGMRFYPGTHKFGYLGDAGEIKKEIICKGWPSLLPSLNPGDFAIMNSSIWHESGPYKHGPDRIITDFIYQSSEDYSTKEIVRGEDILVKSFMNTGNDGVLIKPSARTINLVDNIFLRSRTSKLKELHNKLDIYES